jgi:hypothetical protein
MFKVKKRGAFKAYGPSTCFTVTMNAVVLVDIQQTVRL